MPSSDFRWKPEHELIVPDQDDLMSKLQKRLLETTAAGRLADTSATPIPGFYQSVLDSVGAVIYTVDSELRITGVNKQWDAFALANHSAHLTREHILGANLLDQMSGHALERWRGLCRQLLAGELERYLDEVIAPESSVWRHYSLAAAPLCDSQGGVIGITFVATNITQLKKAEHEMLKRLVEIRGLRQVTQTAGSWADRRKVYKQVTADVANLFSAEKCIIFLWDENTGNLQAQEPAYGLAGRRLAKLSLDMGHPSDPDSLWLDLEEKDYVLLNEGDEAPADMFETSARVDRLAAMMAFLRVSSRIHGAVLVAGHAQPFTDQDGQLLAHLAVPLALSIENAELNRRLLDRTQQLAATQDDLNRLFKIKEAIRMPLSVVRGYLELLLDGVMGPVPESQSAMLRTVQDKTQAIIHLIDRFSPRRFLLDATRYEQIRLTDLLNKVVEHWQPTAGRSGVDLVLQIPDLGEADDLITGDPDMVFWVFSALVGRAIQVSRENETVWASLRVLGDVFHVQIVDGGFLIPPDQLAHIWKPLTDTGDAQIVNLSEIKRIVEGHGGQVWAESRPDQGNIFHVALRRAER
jgi:PAS domain S-box-containing protein